MSPPMHRITVISTRGPPKVVYARTAMACDHNKLQQTVHYNNSTPALLFIIPVEQIHIQNQAWQVKWEGQLQ